MGLEHSRQVPKRLHQQFLKVFKDNYKFSSRENSDIFGDIKLYKNIHTNIIEVVQKRISLATESESAISMKTMEKRVRKPTANMLRIYSIQYEQDRQICGNSCVATIYMEYLHKSLQAELNKRRRNGKLLKEAILIKIAVSLLSGVKYMHDENVFHGEIRTGNILMDESYHLKLAEQSLLSPCRWEIGSTHSQGCGYKILKGHGILLSPCILDCLRDASTQIAGYDAFKADIYSIGMIMLECCSLRKAENFYNYEALQVKENEIAKTIYESRNNYSHNLMNLVEKMLEPDDRDRPSTTQLLQKMETISGVAIQQMNTTLNESFLSETLKSFYM